MEASLSAWAQGRKGQYDCGIVRLNGYQGGWQNPDHAGPWGPGTQWEVARGWEVQSDNLLLWKEWRGCGRERKLEDSLDSLCSHLAGFILEVALTGLANRLDVGKRLQEESEDPSFRLESLCLTLEFIVVFLISLPFLFVSLPCYTITESGMLFTKSKFIPVQVPI